MKPLAWLMRTMSDGDIERASGQRRRIEGHARASARTNESRVPVVEAALGAELDMVDALPAHVGHLVPPALVRLVREDDDRLGRDLDALLAREPVSDSLDRRQIGRGRAVARGAAERRRGLRRAARRAAKVAMPGVCSIAEQESQQRHWQIRTLAARDARIAMKLRGRVPRTLRRYSPASRSRAGAKRRCLPTASQAGHSRQRSSKTLSVSTAQYS